MSGWLCAADAERQSARPRRWSGAHTRPLSFTVRVAMNTCHGVFAALLGLLALTVPAVGISCSCVAIDPDSAYAHLGLIVIVRVTAVDATPPQGPWDVTVQPLRTWKGSIKPGTSHHVHTPGPTGPCGFFIHANDEFIVYGQDGSTLPDFILCNTVRGRAVPKHLKRLDALAHGQR
jgi:hypothetical protein